MVLFLQGREHVSGANLADGPAPRETSPRCGLLLRSAIFRLMSEHIPEYSHVTLLKGVGAVVVRVHSHHPLFDFYIARDHGSDIIEAASSIAGAAKGEVGVCFDRRT